MRTLTLIAPSLATVLGTSLLATAQTPYRGPDGSLLGLEQRFNHLQYFATHNSYQRDGCTAFDPDVSLRTQLDRHDAWCVELDLRWHDDLDVFWIAHSCYDGSCGDGSLTSFLDQIATSRRAADGFTLVDFETGDIGPCVFYPTLVPKPDGWDGDLRTILQNRFGNAVYTRLDLQLDGDAWPSPQELIRRGKHFAFVIKGSSSLGYFMPANTLYGPGEWLNTPDEQRVIALTDLGNLRMARHYPNGTDCSSESDADYETAVANGFSFAATNCSDRGQHLYQHPPVPMYVNRTSGSSSARGTWELPLAGSGGFSNLFVASAIHSHFHAPSMVVASLEGGVHDVTPSGLRSFGGPLTVDVPNYGRITAAAPVRLTARDGQMVTLR